ncbi:hypothetical protein [Streptosporangium sp. CA-115845]|uniref:hypothetical protein n=1 Tax=Streptosporangium sp. CA-115845 TaxID=3240071 RepID=UPI003D8B6C68
MPGERTGDIALSWDPDEPRQPTGRSALADIDQTPTVVYWSVHQLLQDVALLLKEGFTPEITVEGARSLEQIRQGAVTFMASVRKDRSAPEGAHGGIGDVRRVS